MARIHVEPGRELDRFVELGRRGLLERANELTQVAVRAARDVFERFAITLAVIHRDPPYPLISMPMLRAVPSTMAIPASVVLAFRSGILRAAISLTWALVTEPTLFRLGSPEPLARLAARLRRIAAGGVLTMKVKDLSFATLITTGTIRPAWLCVCSLNCLQNAMMLIPA